MKKKITKLKKAQKNKLPPLHSVVRNFLEKNGWNVVVLGGTSVESTDLKFNFRFVMNFTGSKKPPTQV